MSPSLARAARLLALAAPGAIAIGSLLPSPGSAQAQASKAQGPLVGSQRQLMAIPSMVEAIGRRLPQDPGRYILGFRAGGTARLQLACHRGQAPWQASPAQPMGGPSSQEQGGTLRFGPVDLSRALCPPPSLAAPLAEGIPFNRALGVR